MKKSENNHEIYIICGESVIIAEFSKFCKGTQMVDWFCNMCNDMMFLIKLRYLFNIKVYIIPRNTIPAFPPLVNMSQQ